MRLGDLDALKEELELSKYIIPNDLNRLLNSEINRCIEAVDNAPTVAVNCKNCDGYEAGYSAGLKDAERPKGEFTDLERKVIADSINYLLGAELLEENGYTEEVVNALKSVLQKIGAEEKHL